MPTKPRLIDEIETFLRRTGMPHTVFGSEAVGDKKVVLRLRKGRDVHSQTADRIRAYIERHRPKNPRMRAAYQPTM